MRDDVPPAAAHAPASSGAPAELWASVPWRAVARTAFPFVVVGGLWEVVARAGIFPPRLFPPLDEVAETFVRLTAAGILPHHAFETVVRLMAGFGMGAVVGVALGIMMGRWRRAEGIFLRLVSLGAHVPGLAYAPLFLLWFGLGNVGAVILVAFVAAFPIVLNTWTGAEA